MLLTALQNMTLERPTLERLLEKNKPQMVRWTQLQAGEVDQQPQSGREAWWV